MVAAAMPFLNVLSLIQLHSTMLSELQLKRSYHQQQPPPLSTLRSINLFAPLHCKLSTGLIAGWLTAENQMKFVHFVCFGNKLSCEFIKFNENFVHYALFNSIPFYGGAQNNSKLFWRFFKYFITVVFAITFTACIIVLLAVFDYIL